MKKNVDLTNGSIYKKLFILALPIITTSFLQMAYNMMDMLWLGNYDPTGEAVTAAGTAGFFTWFGMAFVVLVKVGAEVKVAQSIGEKNRGATINYIKSSIQMIIVLGIMYGLAIFFLKGDLIGFFNTKRPILDKMSVDYLGIIAMGIVFYFVNPVFTSIYNGSGDSITPLIMNFVGIGINLILDPILIFGLGGFPEMGIKGAAIATIIAQAVVTLLFVLSVFFTKKGRHLFEGVNIFKGFEEKEARTILKIGKPIAIQSGLFTIFSMTIGRIISEINTIGIGVQKVGSQIESLSWMTASGFQTALSTFVGQNYGAKKWDRIYKGYLAAVSIVAIFGVFVSIGFVVFAEQIFKLFISNEGPLAIGTVYMKILGISQFFMCIEIATAGAFNGLGKTKISAKVSIIFTFLRVPAAWILAKNLGMGLNGVWWSISISSIFKGVVMVGLFIIFLSRHPEIGFDKIKAHFRKEKKREIAG